jgi:uncharacterized protein YecE (DUF72 family)
VKGLFDGLKPAPRAEAPRVCVGPAGWSYADWEGVVYPPAAGRSFDRLAAVARLFDAIEVNSTFYRIPEEASAEKWLRSIDPRSGFLFAVKAWQGFTHSETAASAGDVAAFRRAVEPLRAASRLGAVLLQFPFYFSNTEAARERVRALAGALASLPLAIEVRHDSWTTPEGLAFLASMDLSICNIDMPLARHSPRPAALATGKLGYVRLHGRNADAWFSKESTRDEKYDWLYGEDEIDEWVARILELRAKTERTFVVANNHFRGQAVTNALELRARLEGGRVEVPEPLLAAYPRLARIARR